MKLLPQSTVHWALSKSCSLRPADRKGQNHREWSVENLSLLTASPSSEAQKESGCKTKKKNTQVFRDMHS